MGQSQIVLAWPVCRQVAPEQVKEPSPSQPRPGKASRGSQLSCRTASNI